MNSDNLDQIIISGNGNELELCLVWNMMGNNYS